MRPVSVPPLCMPDLTAVDQAWSVTWRGNPELCVCVYGRSAARQRTPVRSLSIQISKQTSFQDTSISSLVQHALSLSLFRVDSLAQGLFAGLVTRMQASCGESVPASHLKRSFTPLSRTYNRVRLKARRTAQILVLSMFVDHWWGERGPAPLP